MSEAKSKSPVDRRWVSFCRVPLEEKVVNQRPQWNPRVSARPTKEKDLAAVHNHRNVQLPPSCTKSVVHFLIGISFNAELRAQSCLALLDKLFQLTAHVADSFIRNTVLLCLSLSVAFGFRAHELSAGAQATAMPIA
jgi:hypothetical protein